MYIGTLSSIIATQMLTPFKAAGCSTEPCSPNTVDVTSVEAYIASDGPYRFTVYGLVLIVISIVACLVFTPYLPASKEQCHEWMRRGNISGDNESRGYVVMVLSSITIVVSAVLL
jgi:hypothetical protein